MTTTTSTTTASTATTSTATAPTRSTVQSTPGVAAGRPLAASRDDFVTLRSMTNETVPEDPALATLVDVLDDECARTILAATSTEPMSASELSDVCDVSESTIYRRVDRLDDATLLAQRTRPRADGHHETVYVATLDRFEVELRDGEFALSVTRRGDDLADQLTDLWGALAR